MDLQLFFRVIWRFKFLVFAGLLLAFALSFLSFASVSFEGGKPTVSYREHEQWESLSTLFLTAEGFTWGSVVDPELLAQSARPTEEGGQRVEIDPARLADVNRLAGLAKLYMPLATGDAVHAIMLEDGPIDGVLQTFPVVGADDSLLPMITLSAMAATPERANALAKRHLKAFLTFLRQRQNRAGIPENERVKVEVVRQPAGAALLEPRKKTRPIIVFLTVLIAVVGLAFVLENLRPRVKPVASADQMTPQSAGVKASASRVKTSSVKRRSA